MTMPVRSNLSEDVGLFTLTVSNKAWFYDIECFPNFFCVTFKNIKTKEKSYFEISKNRNDIFPLCSFLNDVEWLVGYNNLGFDDKFLYYIFKYRDELCSNLTKLNYYLFLAGQLIIKDAPEFKSACSPSLDFKSFDLMAMMNYHRKSVSLKKCAVWMGWKIIQDLPIPFDSEVQDTEIEKVKWYNNNDVEITEALYHKLKKEINLRAFLTDKYQMPMWNANETAIGKLVFLTYWNARPKTRKITSSNQRIFRTYHSKINLKDVIFPFIEFQTDELKAVKEKIEKTVIYGTKGNFEVHFEFNELGFKLAQGGLHSKNKGEIIEPSENEEIIDLDGNYYYPALMDKHKIFPRHLGEDFCSVVSDTIRERTFWKFHPEKKNPEMREFIAQNDKNLKISINSIFGLLMSEFSFLYDQMAGMKVTINGQLLLLMLIERFHLHGIRTVYANTDGVTIVCPKDKKTELDSIVRWWENLSQIDLELKKYKKIINANVNNYIWIDDEGEIKQKGWFLPVKKRDADRDVSNEIVGEAVNEFMLKGTPIEQTIMSCKEILKFSISKRVGIEKGTEKPYSLYLESEDGYSEKISKTTRFFVSKSDKYLVKRGERKQMRIITSHSQSLLNILDENKSFDEYDLDYSYYIGEAQKIIDIIHGITQIKRKKSTKFNPNQIILF